MTTPPHVTCCWPTPTPRPWRRWCRACCCRTARRSAGCGSRHASGRCGCGMRCHSHSRAIADGCYARRRTHVGQAVGRWQAYAVGAARALHLRHARAVAAAPLAGGQCGAQGRGPRIALACRQLRGHLRCRRRAVAALPLPLLPVGAAEGLGVPVHGIAGLAVRRWRRPVLRRRVGCLDCHRFNGCGSLGVCGRQACAAAVRGRPLRGAGGGRGFGLTGRRHPQGHLRGFVPLGGRWHVRNRCRRFSTKTCPTTC